MAIRDLYRFFRGETEVEETVEAPEPDEDIVYYQDRNGNWLSIPRSQVAQAVVADDINLMEDIAESFGELQWEIGVPEVRCLIDIAQQEEDPEMALFTILANTNIQDVFE